jgi:CDGSH-type Zn-finger protein
MAIGEIIIIDEHEEALVCECGTENDVDASYCQGCGGEFGDEGDDLDDDDSDEDDDGD